MRRLPIFLVIDVSESMAGDNLRNLQQGMDRLVLNLRSDPHALETVFLSVIVFAGRPKTLTPLVELFQFYTPRLPLGSGTSIGAALDHVMNVMDQSLVRSTADKKGDYKPVVYFMSDGKSTDTVQPALDRWKAKYADRATLVAIGIGPHADLQALSRITDNVLRFEGNSDAEFQKFVDWVSQSVQAQSRSIGTGEPAPISLEKHDDVMKKIDDIAAATAIDEDFVILHGRCQKTRLPYLMRYEKAKLPFQSEHIKTASIPYALTGVFAAEEDFFDLSDPRANAQMVSTDQLAGSPGCPHCGAPIAFAVCSCGQIFCIQGPGPATCPGCKQNLELSPAEGAFDVSRGRG